MALIYKRNPGSLFCYIKFISESLERLMEYLVLVAQFMKLELCMKSNLGKLIR